jgi:hypothetical protein
VPNWIDASGGDGAHLAFRLIGARTEPEVSTEVVPIRDLGSRLPADHPVINAATRRDALARRRAAVLARYV